MVQDLLKFKLTVVGLIRSGEVREFLSVRLAPVSNVTGTVWLPVRAGMSKLVVRAVELELTSLTMIWLVSLSSVTEAVTGPGAAGTWKINSSSM